LGPWWDACLTDFRQYYQLDLRDAWETLPGIDFVTHVRRLIQIRDAAFRKLILGDLAEWGPDEENRALLLEVQHYQLELGWLDRITDPDDPELKREQAQAKREGKTPPK